MTLDINFFPKVKRVRQVCYSVQWRCQSSFKKPFIELWRWGFTPGSPCLLRKETLYWISATTSTLFIDLIASECRADNHASTLEVCKQRPDPHIRFVFRRQPSVPQSDLSSYKLCNSKQIVKRDCFMHLPSPLSSAAQTTLMSIRLSGHSFFAPHHFITGSMQYRYSFYQ